MSKAFKLQKKYLVGLATWLNNQALSGKLSRERTRFVALLAEGVHELEKERKET